MALFEKIKYSGSQIKNWEYKTLDIYDNLRLYWKKDDEGNGVGFSFACLEFKSCSAGGKNYWDDPSLELEVDAKIFGIARFDGLKHIWFSDTTFEEDLDKEKIDGYNYYPNAGLYAKVFQELRILEEQYCSDIEYLEKS